MNIYSKVIKRKISSFLKYPTTTDFNLVHYRKDNMPLFTALDMDGRVLNESVVRSVPKDVALSSLKQMVQLSVFEKIMLEAQRQGRISFFMKSTGEEACSFGAATALHPKDWIYTQYREAGAYLTRGFTLENMIDTNLGTVDCSSKGRQMPMHYGFPKGRLFTVSSPLATQIPQAVGSAYAAKMGKDNQCVAVFFGDGASSEGDCLASFNFAQTLRCPLLFLCRNNHFAISTYVKQQHTVDGPADLALGHGISSIRVDGTDFFAIYYAVSEARKYCLENSMPVFLELVSYRLGDHSTSDDSSTYRSSEEIEEAARKYNPIGKLAKYFISENQWSEQEQQELEAQTHDQVVSLLKACEKKKLHPIHVVAEDLFDEQPERLRRQQKELVSHVEKYSEEYNVTTYAQ